MVSTQDPSIGTANQKHQEERRAGHCKIQHQPEKVSRLQFNHRYIFIINARGGNYIHDSLVQCCHKNKQVESITPVESSHDNLHSSIR